MTTAEEREQERRQAVLAAMAETKRMLREARRQFNAAVDAVDELAYDDPRRGPVGGMS